MELSNKEKALERIRKGSIGGESIKDILNAPELNLSREDKNEILLKLLNIGQKAE